MLKIKNISTKLLIIFTLLNSLNFVFAQTKKTDIVWNFDNQKTANLSKSWKIEATNQKSELSTWKIVKDKTAPSKNNVLALVDTQETSGETFNICWTNKISFYNGEINVMFKAIAGDGDQGGGVMWRVQDKNNYYIARFNPLEDNFRIYFVHNGYRRTLASANFSLDTDKWHKLTIIQNNELFEGYLDNKKLLSGHDNHLKKSGGVGLWTKADAATSFDDFSIKNKK